MADGQQLYRSKRKTAEVLFVKCDRVQQVLTKMDFSAFEHRQYFAARTLPDVDLDSGISLCIPVQELREHALDVLRRAGDLQNSGVAMTEQLSLLFQRTGAVE